MKFDGFAGVRNRLFDCFTLRETAGKRRDFRPEPSLFSLVDQYRVFHMFPHSNRSNSSSVSPAFLIAAFRSPILTSPETGIVIS